MSDNFYDLRRERTKSKTTIELRMANGAFFAALCFTLYVVRYYAFLMTAEAFLLLTYVYLILSVVLIGLVHRVNENRSVIAFFVGIAIHAATIAGVVLLAYERLSSSSFLVMKALSKLIFAVFVVWQATASIRALPLDIRDRTPEEAAREQKKRRNLFRKLFSPLYGILYPWRDFWRMITILFYITLSFYLISSSVQALEMLSLTDPSEFQLIKKIASNVMSLSIQAPMLMASRASVTRTLTEYMESKQRMFKQFDIFRYGLATQLAEGVIKRINESQIVLDDINRSGKHLWLSIFFLLGLSIYEEQAVILIERALHYLTSGVF